MPNLPRFTRLARFAPRFVAPVLLALALTGCVATKTDIQNVQNDLKLIDQRFTANVTTLGVAVDNVTKTSTALQTKQTEINKTQDLIRNVLSTWVRGIVDFLEKAPAEIQSQIAVVESLKLARKASGELGEPPAGERIDAGGVLAGDPVALADYRKKIEQKDAEIIALNQNLRAKQDEYYALKGSLDTELGNLKAAKDELKGVQDQLAKLRSKLWWESLWDSIKGPGLILGVVALLIAFPAVIPLIGGAVSSLLRLFPSLMGWFRVVGKDTLENVASGVGRVRQDVDKLAPGATLTREEVLALLKQHLNTTTDVADKQIIDVIRRQKNLG